MLHGGGQEENSFMNPTTLFSKSEGVQQENEVLKFFAPFGASMEYPCSLEVVKKLKATHIHLSYHSITTEIYLQVIWLVLHHLHRQHFWGDLLRLL